MKVPLNGRQPILYEAPHCRPVGLDCHPSPDRNARLDPLRLKGSPSGMPIPRRSALFDVQLQTGQGIVPPARDDLEAPATLREPLGAERQTCSRP